MAEVYLAEQTSLNRRVAVKVLNRDLQTDDVHLKRFQQEAIAAGGLNHPNIVQVYMVGGADGYHYIAQEYVPGLNLRQYVKRKGPPEVPLAVHIMRQAASALAAAGDAGIVHRDIKPENILLTRKGNVKVADFGLAQLSLGGEHMQLTREGVTMGTPLYMSPEQVNGRKLDPRSDIYSLGVTCYHLLCGHPPFQGETGMGIAVQHLNETPEPLAIRRGDLPAGLCDIVHRMMAKEPDERPSDARTIVKELRNLAHSLRTTSGAAIIDPSVVEREAASAPQGSRRPLDRFFSWSWRRQLAVVLLSCVVMAALAGAIGWWLRPDNPLVIGP